MSFAKYIHVMVYGMFFEMKTTKQKHAFIGWALWTLVTEPRDSWYWRHFLWELKMYELYYESTNILWMATSLLKSHGELDKTLKKLAK